MAPPAAQRIGICRFGLIACPPTKEKHGARNRPRFFFFMVLECDGSVAMVEIRPKQAMSGAQTY